MMEKEKLTKVLLASHLTFEGNIDDVIKRLIDLKIKQGRNYSNLHLQITECHHGGPDYYKLFGFRPETNKEKQYRLNEERKKERITKEKQREKKEEEIKELKRLLQIYGKPE